MRDPCIFIVKMAGNYFHHLSFVSLLVDKTLIVLIAYNIEGKIIEC